MIRKRAASDEDCRRTILRIGLGLGMHVACLDAGSLDEHSLPFDGVNG